jgi:hypothetical protein
MVSKKMKSISLAAFGCVFLLGSTTASFAADLKVFLLGGQSNMLGRAPVSGLPLALQGMQSDVLFFGGSDGTVGTTLETLRPDGKSASEFGPEVTFGRAIADASPTTQYALIKYAAGGTALYNDWAPGTGADYTAFRNTVTAGLAALQAAGHTTKIIGMLWHQGENDAIEGRQANYESHLTAFIADIRSNYGANLPFLIGEIRRSNGAAFVTVADAQISVAAADPNAGFVPASDLSFRDTYHFDAPSMITLGERFASGFDALVTGVSPLSLVSITDDQGGSPVTVSTPVTYTLTFSEDMDVTTVGTDDFANAGSSVVSFGALTETVPGVFTLEVIPTTAGTLRIQIIQNAVLRDAGSRLLDTSNPLSDNTIISVLEPAATWVTGVSIEAVSSLFSGNRSADNLINGNGFTEASGFHSSAGGDGISWTSGSSSNAPLGHFVTFDLEANYDLNVVKIWNWNTGSTLSAGSKNIDISVAATVGGSFTPLGNFDLPIGPGQNNVDFGEVIDLSVFGAAGNVRLVRIEINSNHGWTNASFPGLAGLAEIRFSGAAIQPNTFSEWINDPVFGLDPANRGFQDDPDKDGIPNGLEALFGTHPGVPSSGLANLATFSNITTFTHPMSAEVPTDVAGRFYDWSDNLVDWYSSGTGPVEGPTVTMVPVPDGNSTTVTATASEITETLYFRVGVIREE